MKRSCCDHIATLKIIEEETLEWNTGLYMVSVDFKKAFDSINRDMLWKILCYDGVPSKTIKMIQVLYEGFQARVMHEGTMTVVRQGCLLSPLLFLVVVDWVTRQAYGENKTEIQLSMLSKLEDLGFADDLVFLCQKITHARQKFEALQGQADRVGLKVNASKTKEMRIRAPPNTGDIMRRGKALEQVTVFTYLGSIVTTTGGTEEDVEARCRKAQVAFSMLGPVWGSLYISLWTKLRIFNSNVKFILLLDPKHGG